MAKAKTSYEKQLARTQCAIHATGGSLADEVTLLSQWVLPNAAELSARESLLASVSSLVLRIWPRCSIEVFGSAAVDLSLFDSDLDIRVHGDCGRSPVETLGSALMSEPWAGAVRLVKEARVPIVTITEATSNVQADVSFSCLGDGGSATALLAMLMMRYRSFRAVSLVVKLFLAVRGMNKNFHGGLGSFKVYMMVAAMLEQYAGHSIGSDSGAMLLRFFELYGRVADTSRNRLRTIWVPFDSNLPGESNPRPSSNGIRKSTMRASSETMGPSGSARGPAEGRAPA
jgi:non-canonical poly(A) RNA polymerase PAPD5/7